MLVWKSLPMILAIASKISYSSDVVELEPPKHVIFFISLFCSVCVSSRTWWSSAVWVHKSSTVALICRPVPECATWVWYLSLYFRITGHTCLSATVTNTMYFLVFFCFFYVFIFETDSCKLNYVVMLANARLMCKSENSTLALRYDLKWEELQGGCCAFT